MTLTKTQRAEVKKLVDMIYAYRDAAIKEATATEPHYCLSAFVAQDLQYAIEVLVIERDEARMNVPRCVCMERLQMGKR